MSDASQQYPDSAEGARSYLRDETGLESTGARPDPSVEGVWEVTVEDGRRAIVYLAGYDDPFGRERAMNDFEIGDEWEESERTERERSDR